jgi:hypothetical protein
MTERDVEREVGDGLLSRVSSSSANAVPGSRCGKLATNAVFEVPRWAVALVTAVND